MKCKYSLAAIFCLWSVIIDGIIVGSSIGFIVLKQEFGTYT